MSGICGWFSPERPVQADIAAMASALTRFDGTSVAQKSFPWGAAAVASRDPGLAMFQDADCLTVVHGRPRFKNADLAASAAQRGAAFALREAYARWDGELFAHLEGSFALAILDPRRERALLAIDRMATQSLSYATIAGRLVFASSLDAINQFPGGRGEIDPQAIYDYVYFHMVPAPRTIYVDRHRLLPGTFLLWPNGEARATRYWEMRFEEDCKRPFGELKQEFVQCLRKGVAEAANGGNVGAFLSGGTDSSTVAGMLREVTGEPARTYSIGFDAEGFDETSYARIAARHFGTRHHEYRVTPQDVVAAIPRIAAVHDQPFGNSSAVPTYYCAKLAKDDGIDVLLGGDGGDELFGGNARYATQTVYAAYEKIPSALRKAAEPLTFAMPEIGPIGKVQRYIRTASQSMPERYDNYNLLERLGAENVFTRDFLSSVDRYGPKRGAADVYRAVHAQSLINHMLAFDWKYTLADNDLPKVSRSCELAGVEVRYPLLDDTIVAFSGKLEPDLKLRGVKLRYFFKEALRGFLPPEIIAKKKHGFGLPFGTWLQSHHGLRDVVFGNLASLKKREIFALGFVDRLTSHHVREHSGYFGTMVWLLVAFEQWIEQHETAVA